MKGAFRTLPRRNSTVYKIRKSRTASKSFFRTIGLVLLLSILAARGFPSQVHATDPTVKLAVGQSLTYSVTQNTPGPTSVTITVSRPDATHLTVTADAPSVNPGACTLGLGGTFNVQSVLTPNPIPGSVLIVWQTTAASEDPLMSPNYDAIYPDGSDTTGPLAAIGISAMYTDGYLCGPSATGGTLTAPPGSGYVKVHGPLWFRLYPLP